MSYERRLVIVLTIVGGIAALDTQAVFYIMPFIRPELHLNNSQVGLIGSAVVIGWSVAALLVSWISDQIGRRRPFIIGAFFAFAALSGLSALARSFLQLLAARFLVGLAEGPVLPMSHSLVMASSAPERRGLNMGVVQLLGSQLVGSLAAPIILVWLAGHIGWRAAFLIAAVPGLLSALLLMAVIREPRRTAAAAREAPSALGLRHVLGNRNVRVCIAISTCCVAWYFLLLSFLPLWLTQEEGLSSGTMSVILSLVGAAGAVGAFVVAGLSDRIGRKLAITAFCCLGVLSPLAALIFGHTPVLLGAMFFTGALMVGSFSIFMGTLPQESVSPADGASATAMVLCISQILGGVAGPAVGGVLADRISPAAPLVLAAFLAVGAVLFSLLLRNPQREDQQHVLARAQPALQGGAADV
jgi:predicted MFS family arabinose efflux permease